MVSREDNQPLPEGHPFKGGRIIFRMKRPSTSGKPSTPRETSSFKTGTPQKIIDWAEKGIYEATDHQMSQGSPPDQKTDESASSISEKEMGSKS